MMCVLGKPRRETSEETKPAGRLAFHRGLEIRENVLLLFPGLYGIGSAAGRGTSMPAFHVFLIRMPLPWTVQTH